jgi:hypothetical protein
MDAENDKGESTRDILPVPGSAVSDVMESDNNPPSGSSCAGTSWINGRQYSRNRPSPVLQPRRQALDLDSPT